MDDRPDYYFSTFRNWAWLNWSKSSVCFVVLWIVSGTFLSLPLTGTWGKLGHEEETFSCTITSSDGKQRSTKNPLFFLMILGKYEPIIIFNHFQNYKKEWKGKEYKQGDYREELRPYVGQSDNHIG